VLELLGGIVREFRGVEVSLDGSGEGLLGVSGYV
jgi:hypothetical protein